MKNLWKGTKKQEQANPKKAGKTANRDKHWIQGLGSPQIRGQFVFFASLGGAFLFPYSAACFFVFFCEKNSGLFFADPC